MLNAELQSSVSEIHNLLTTYAFAADAFDGVSLAACFTAEGTLERMDGQHRGTTAIAAAIRNPGTKARRHLFQLPIIEFTSDSEATGRGYCLYIEYDLATSDTSTTVIDYRDVYLRTVDGWRLDLRSVRPSFMPASD